MKEHKTYLSVHDLLKKVDNKFLVCMAVARRARQIKEGAKPLDPISDSELPVISAIEEFLHDKVAVDYEQSAAEGETQEQEESMKVLRRKTRRAEEAVPVSAEDAKKEQTRLNKKVKLERAKKRTKSLVA